MYGSNQADKNQMKLHYDFLTDGIDISKAYMLCMTKKVEVVYDYKGNQSFKNNVSRRFVQSFDELISFYQQVNEEIINPNVYVSVNTFFIPVAKNRAVHKFHFLFADIDCHDKENPPTKHDIDSLYFHLCEDYFGAVVPVPSMIVSTGRGMHIYWKIKPLSYNDRNIRFFNKVEGNLLAVLSSIDMGKFEVDFAARNASRVLRLAGTYNTSAQEYAEIVDINTHEYTLTEINQGYLFPEILDKILAEKSKREQYKRIPSVKDTPKANKKKRKRKKKSLCKGYSNDEEQRLLNMRLDDLCTLVTLRHGDMAGYRNLILWQIHNILMQLGYSATEKERLIKEVNSQFTERLPDSEIKHILSQKEVYRHLQNKYLITILNIGAEEQEHLKTIVGAAVRSKRLSTQKMSIRQTQKAVMLQKIAELANKGYTQKQIAEQIGVSIRTIKSYYKLLGINKKPLSNRDNVLSLKGQSYSQQETAEKLGISIRTVRKYWH